MKNKIGQLIFFVLLVLTLAACGAEKTDDYYTNMSAPEFTLDNALGGKTSLSDYSGKPVLLFFHMAVG